MKMKYNNLIFLASLIPSALVIAGNLNGGWFVLSAGVFLILLSLPDLILKSNQSNANPEEKNIPVFILALHPLLLTGAIFSLLFGIYTGIISGIFVPLAIISTGMGAGSSGTLSGHELIHRRNWLKYLGLYNLFLLNYSHYFVEHIQGHHPNVATELDPSTALKNESFYTFFIKAIPWQLRDAWKFQTRLLEKKGKVWSLQNYLLTAWGLKVLFLVALFLVSPVVLVAFIGQSLVARFIHESISYTQHYGILRQKGERVNATHSWQSNSLIGEMFLLELTRHSDHHTKVTKNYFELQTLPEAPTAPFGYFAAFLFVLIPPLWFRTMNPILENAQA